MGTRDGLSLCMHLHGASPHSLLRSAVALAWLPPCFQTTHPPLSPFSDPRRFRAPQIPFLRHWAVGLGLENASQFWDVFKQCVLLFVVLQVLYRVVHIFPSVGKVWFEEVLDFGSIQATLFTRTPKTLAERTKAHLDFTRTVK